MHAVDIYGLSEVIGPGVASECVETKDGLTVWEDHFYPEVVDPVTWHGAARRLPRRTGVHVADQAGDARRALPHPRPDPAAARHGPPDAPHREDHRTGGRHAHRARRQPVPHADRGADPGVPELPRTSSAC